MSKECQLCFTSQKKKLNSCQHCSKMVCNTCMPEKSQDSKCYTCIREEIRESILSDHLAKKSKLEKELEDLMDSAQHTQLEIELLEDKYLHLENFKRSCEITHEEKLNNLQLSINKTRREWISMSTIENLETLVENSKKTERKKRSELHELQDNVESEKLKIDSDRELERMTQNRINELKSLNANNVPYEELRCFICEKCSKAVKTRFKELLISGHIGNKSVIESVVSIESTQLPRVSTLRTRVNVSKISSASLNQNRHQSENCVCDIF